MCCVLLCIPHVCLKSEWPFLLLESMLTFVSSSSPHVCVYFDIFLIKWHVCVKKKLRYHDIS